MLKRWLHRKLAAFEDDYGYDAAYGHEMLDTSRKAFLRFARIYGMAQHREDVPLAAWYAAKLAATMAEDCGPCTQLVVTMAERAGVPSRDLQAIVEGDTAAMGEDASLGWRFATAALAHDPAADELRQQVVDKWGNAAVVSLALAMAASRAIPTIKYAMGHGKTCGLVHVAGAATRRGAHGPASGALTAE